MARSINQSMINGSILMVAMRWSIRFIGLISTVILARLLSPEDFGIVAMAMLMLELIDIFFSLSVDLALIQEKHLEDSHYNTGWTLKVLQGVALIVVLLALLPLAIAYFDEPRLIHVIPVLCLGIVFESLSNIGLIDFRRDLDFAKEFKFNVIKKIASFAITIIAAIFLGNYWALLIGIVSGQLMGCIMSYVMHNFRPRFGLKKFKDLWKFSQWMLVINVINYANNRGSQLIVGGTSSPTTLGHYTVANELSQLPTTELIFPITRALFPGFAKIKSEPEKMDALYLNSLGFIATFCLSMGLGIALTANNLVVLLYGSQWTAAIPFVVTLALFGVIRTLYSTSGNVLMALGHSKPLAYLTCSEAATMIALSLVAIPYLGALGVAIARVVTSIIFSTIYFRTLFRFTNLGFEQITRVLFRPVVAGFFMTLLLTQADKIPGVGNAPMLAIKFVIGAMSYSACIFILWHIQGKPEGAESQLINLLRQKFQKT